MWFDTHCHLSDDCFDDVREQLIADLPKAGVGYVLDAGTNLEDSQKAIANAGAHQAVYASVGYHPDYITHLPDDYLEQLKALALSHPKVVAIGEIGLDYHYDVDPRPYQQRRMAEMLDLAAEINKPVIIHDRDAHGDTLALLKQHNRGGSGVLHCFSGSLEMAVECCKLGYYISIGGVITFKNAKKLKEMVQYLPKDRIVVETDSPCLAPVPYRGKTNQPAYVNYVGQVLAEHLGISEEACQRLTTENALRLFGIGEQNGNVCL